MFGGTNNYHYLWFIKVTIKLKNMTTLNLNSKKVTTSTSKMIAEFIYANRETLSNEMKMFYNNVKGIIDLQLNKKAARRMSMEQILERAYNIESYVLASGAASFETQFVKL